MSNKRILCVDDEPALRLTVVDTLSGQGYIVDEASDGNDAIRKLEAQQYDLILLDIVMPGKSGLDVLRVLSEKASRPAVVMLTGRAGFTIATETLKLGAVEYITKPVIPSYLLDTIARLLG